MTRKKSKNQQQQPCSSKQADLKDMLREVRRKHNQIPASTEQEEEISTNSDTKVIPILLKHNDIREPKYDEISIQAKSYYLEHSNIHEIFQKYLDDRNLNYASNRAGHLNQVIRAVTSTTNSKRKYPFNEFKWNSIDDEMIAKELLMHPSVSSNDDVNEMKTFYKNNDIKFCAINMAVNNDLFKNSKEFLDVKRKKYSSKNLLSQYQHATNFALEKYFRESNTQKIYELKEITVEEMCMISTFEKCVCKELKIDNITQENENLLMTAMKIKLQKLRNSPELLYNDSNFSVKPQYILRSNNITPQQERFLARKRERLYEYSNAKWCLLMNKQFFPSNLDDPRERDKERQKNFYLEYLRSKDRRRPPFHNLLWDKRFALHDDGQSVYIITEKDPVLQQQLHFEERIQNDDMAQRQQQKEVNADPELQVTNEISSSSELNQITIVSQRPTATDTNNSIRIEYELKDYEQEIVKILFLDQEFIAAVKNHLRVKHAELFKEIWKDKKIVVSNLIIKALRENRDAFEKLLSHSSTDTKTKIDAVLNANNINTECSFATSTQCVNDSTSIPRVSMIGTNNSVRRPLQLDEDSLHDIIPVIQQNDIESSMPKEIEIKKEKSDEEINTPQSTVLSDSCVIVSQVPEAIIEIEDSDDETKKVYNELNYSEHSLDEFQRNMNKNSDEIDWCKSKDKSRNVSEKISPYTDIAETNANVENKSQNNQEKVTQSSGSSNNEIQEIPPNKPVNSFNKRRSKRPTKGLQFLSDTINNSSEEQSGNESNTGEFSQMLNANFSVFLSTQVMLDHDTNMVEPTALTFTKPTTSTNNELGKMCFYIELRQVIFKKDSVFQIVIDIPEYSLYNVSIDDENIKEALNLNDNEWNILLSNLSQLEAYEYGAQSHHNYQGTQFEKQISQHLDMYFSSISKFKNFILNFSSDGHTCQIKNPALNSLSTDLTDVLNKNLVNQIKLIN
ncbi:hypothetical protein PVAND_007327 [Polypedilum vanderplanki]|uniref:Uncharacterized protein n=1 Tax=Polypedilum vanderplanki TaxID=319348 RepID=A0A9J6C6C2_POLVA|nr:hypothetical protein PVAND_007327 [Polypedilum vanderplanki]